MANPVGDLGRRERQIMDVLFQRRTRALTKARILSDWDLEPDPLTDRDDRFGTPRRILRSRAVLGRGAGRLTVLAVNGGIEIRRR